MEGGNGTADVLTGKVTPCGKLSDTIAYEISDYPSDKNFGDLVENYYQEDIYVGYRYFETFAPDRVLYPFGYGLSYTTFSIEVKAAFAEKCNVVDRDSTVKVEVLVTNTGKVAGKEVVQLYYTAPQGKLGKAVKVLGAFAKTKLLAPDETEVVLLEMPIFRMASYDDSGVTGNKSCWLLEEGAYEIHVGNHVRDTVTALTFEMDKTVVTDVVEEAMTPVKAFTRLKPIKNTNSSCGTGFQEGEEQVPLRTYDLAERICSRCPVEFEKKDDMHYVLADVADGKLSLEEFVAQLNDEELMCLVRGEGMCSPKVTPGTASAFGGLTASLQGYGIPVGCCADGPSGIRMDCGTEATSIPNGTAIACTWNTALTEEMFVCMGKELIENHIDTLLGPGLNIHRHPLNGRNFEYFSEDPYLTGTMAVAEIRGMNQTKATGTIKHFCGNNQEAARHESNSVISERALREVYLKPFEIAIKDGGARSVMTSYNAVNGIWTAGSYDLNTTILRNEWRYEGIVMTDWWADINDDGDIPSRTNTKAMIKAQNDIYMVVEDTLKNSANDNLSQALADGTLTRGELQRSVANLCRFLLATPAFERMQAQPDAEGTAIDKDIDNAFVADELILKDELVVSLYGVDTGRGKRVAFPVYAPEGGSFRLELVTLADAPPLAQLPISIFRGSNLLTTFMVHDTANEWVTMTKEISVKKGHFYLRVMFGMSGTECKTLRLVKI